MKRQARLLEQPEQTVIQRCRQFDASGAHHVQVFRHRHGRRRHTQFVENHAIGMGAHQHPAAAEDPRVEQRRRRHQRGIVCAVEAKRAQLAAVVCDNCLLVHLLLRLRELCHRCVIRRRAEILGHALATRVVAIAIHKLSPAPPLGTDAARRQQRHCMLRQRQLLRLRISRVQRNIEIIQFNQIFAIFVEYKLMLFHNAT